MAARAQKTWGLLLALVLGVGAGAAWGLATLLTIDFAYRYFAPATGYESLFVGREGQVLIQTVSYAPYSISYRTLDGQPVAVAPEPSRSFVAIDAPAGKRGRYTRALWSQRLMPLFRTVDYYALAWYLVDDGEDDGRAYLVSYDKRTNLQRDYCGRRGFSQDRPPRDQWFTIRGEDLQQRYAAMHEAFPRVYLLTGEGLVMINLLARTVQNIFPSRQLIAVREVTVSKPAGNEQLLLGEPERLTVITLEGQTLRSFPLPEGLREASFLWWGLEDGRSICQTRDYRRPNVTPEIVLWLDSAGKVLRREEVPLRCSSYASETYHMTEVCVSLPSPVLLAVSLVMDAWVTEAADVSTRIAILRKLFDRRWPALAITLAVSSLLAVLCYRRQRRYGLPWTGLWTLLVLLGGWPVWLGYWAYRVWPARLACPHCGRPAPRDRPACILCGKEFPVPAAKGIEVFA